MTPVPSHAVRTAAVAPAGGGRRPVPPPLRSLAQGLAGAVVGAAAARAAYAVLTLPERACAPAGTGAQGATGTAPGDPRAEGTAGAPGADVPSAWLRRNFRGRVVTLQEGPALASGVCAASLLVPGPAPRVRAASALAAAGAAAFGAYDDLSGNGQARGLRGHLAALARGEVTTGLVKMVGIGATGVAAASLLRRGPVDTLVDGALIAAGANLVNLFDLRPGRAAKFALLAAAPALASPAAPLLGPVVGACSALLPDELAERSMLGDAGANALGAALGAAAVAQAPRPVRLALFGAVAALTLASEVTSFSRVIDRVPALRRLDQWGRSPVRRTAAGGAEDDGRAGAPGEGRPVGRCA
ncbi:hypothetical protein [Nocardiopsis tropica]|uniref:hypothetical protein n=1 Tax=Nocardiopsis tropica TaxID=109330 RepID=UPI00399D25CF